MGKFKSGIEPYTRDSMSDAFRESMTGLLGDLYAQMLEKIADGRDGITAELASELIDRGPFTAKEAHESKLVDTLQYYDELLDTIKEKPDAVLAEQDDKKKRKMPDMNSFAGMMQLFSIYLVRRNVQRHVLQTNSLRLSLPTVPFYPISTRLLP